MEYKSTREGYADALLELGKTDPNVVVVCADLANSTGSGKFAEKFPERFIEVGVAEQNLATVSAGMALNGKKVFMASYAAFSPGRNYDFIRTQICYSNANVKIIGSHSGLSASADGATHQMLEDIAMMRVLPNTTVLSPCDYWEAKKAVIEAASLKGPVYIRLHREETPTLTHKEDSFSIGKWAILKEGKDICIISHGPITDEAVKAGENLKDKNISVQIISASTIKPLDTNTLLQTAQNFKEIIVLEEHQKSGGLGSAICEFLSSNCPTKVVTMGINDSFGESGSYGQLIQKFGLDRRSIAQAVLTLKNAEHN